MKKQRQFLLEIRNQSIENLKYMYSKNLLNEIRGLFKLFRNKKLIEIVFFTKHDEMRNKLNCNIVPQWIRGITVGDTIYLLKYSQDFYDNIDEFYMVLLHEIIHVLIYRKIKQPCPLWLNEGLALVLSKQYKNMDFECFLNFEYELSSYDENYFYEKCCAKTVKCVNKYGKKQLITKLIKNQIDSYHMFTCN